MDMREYRWFGKKIKKKFKKNNNYLSKRVFFKITVIIAALQLPKWINAVLDGDADAAKQIIMYNNLLKEFPIYFLAVHYEVVLLSLLHRGLNWIFQSCVGVMTLSEKMESGS